jgi:hypothetical protein
MSAPITPAKATSANPIWKVRFPHPYLLRFPDSISAVKDIGAMVYVI